MMRDMLVDRMVPSQRMYHSKITMLADFNDWFWLI